MGKKFLNSVADAYLYNGDDVLLAVAKTLVDSSIETTLSSQEIRGGRGNKLQFVYHHTTGMTINLTDAQWNLELLSITLGQDITTGANLYVDETVTLGAGATGTVTGTPLVTQGTTVYGWVTHVGVDTPERVTFTGQNFTSSVGAENDIVCVRYYELKSGARSLKIPANIVPEVARIVLETQLNETTDSSTNTIGVVQIIIPQANLTGSFSIGMTADGVAQTPIVANALASNALITGACTDVEVYAEIIEDLDADWYDDVIGLAIEGGDFTLANAATQQLVVWAIRSGGTHAPFQPPVADLTFASSVVADATVSAGGLVTWVSDGETVVKASITAKTEIDANVVVTTTA